MSFLLAFLSILPLALFLQQLLRPDYRTFLLPVERFLRARHSPFGSGLVAGVLGGILAALTVQLIHQFFWADVELEFRPSSAVGWTLQLAFLRASLTEELVKCSFAFLAMHLICRRKGRYRSSAPILAGATGLGFAFLENSGYFTIFGSQGLLGLFVSRFFFAATAHVLSNLMFGLWFYRNQEQRLRAFFSGTLLAILAHGIYDFFAFAQAPLAGFLVLLTLVIMTLSTVLLYQMIFRVRRLRRLRRRSGRPASLENTIFHDAHARKRPPVALRREEQMNLQKETMDILLLDHSVALLPEPLRLVDARWQQKLRPFSVAFWDSASLADHADYDGLLAIGIDLTSLRPLRIATISRPEGSTYLSIGLAAQQGTEVYIAMPGPFPTVKLFLLALSSGLQLPELYVPERISATLAGDPHDWIHSFVRVPPTDDLLLLAAGSEALSQIFFYSRPETRYLERHGWPALLKLQREKGLSWQNDFTRPFP